MATLILMAIMSVVALTVCLTLLAWAFRSSDEGGCILFFLAVFAGVFALWAAEKAHDAARHLDGMPPSNTAKG